MEINDGNLAVMANYLQQTLSADSGVRNPAEKFLSSVEANKNFPVLLLSLIGGGVDLNIKVAASITFKNYVKRNWKVSDDSDDRIHPDDRAAIKQLIVDLMLKSAPAVQKQLSEAIAIIGQHDFPAKWTNLLNDMVTRFSSGDFHIINGVLQTASSIFEKYSYQMKSQTLWEEIKFVLDNFSKPFTDLLNATMELSKTHATNPEALKVIFRSLVLIAKIFYFLNYQDLPEFFEDNMNTWMTHFLTLLTSDNALLKTDDDEEPGLLEELKSQICDNIGLYAHKYEEEFQPYMSPFVESVWNLLLTTGPQVKYDMLVSNAIQFIASVAAREQYKPLFESGNILASICEKIIVPNMEMRPCDVEMFEDNPEEFIRRDLEGSDVDTRRRAACDLVKGLSRYFEAQITDIFGAYVKSLLAAYASAPAREKWRSKDAAIYLVTSLATRAKTAKHGITQTNQLVDLGDFANQHIVPDLQSPNGAGVNDQPVLKADAVKYVLTFRSQLPPQAVKAWLPHIVKLLRAQSHVVHTYAAAAIEKILILKAPGTTTALVSAIDLQPVAGELLTSLFGAFQLQASAENEYVMKCVVRSFSTLQEAAIPYLAQLLPILTAKLRQAAKNPTRPHYNHYLFESLVLSIRIVCRVTPTAVENFEQVLFPVVQEILQGDVQEFVPYVFQVLSVLLELHTDSVPQSYMELFPFLLVPELWERHGNVPPLVRLIQAFISRGSKQIVQQNKVESLLGVFQKLIASKSNDHEGFFLLRSLVEFMPEQTIASYIKQIFLCLFNRLTSSKTTKYVKHFLVFIFYYAIRYNGTNLQEMIDSIQPSQPNLFGMVVERLVLVDVQKINGAVEKKIAAVGMVKLLCETAVMVSGQYSNYWMPVLQALIGFFELPEDNSTCDDEHFAALEAEPTGGGAAAAAGYQTAYSVLVFAGRRAHDPVAAVADPRNHLAQSLGKLSSCQPGRVSPLVAQMHADAQKHLQKYLHAAGVTIA